MSKELLKNLNQELIERFNEKLKTKGVVKFQELVNQVNELSIIYDFLRDSEIEDILNDVFTDDEHKKVYINNIQYILHGLECYRDGMLLMCKLFDTNEKERE